MMLLKKYVVDENRRVVRTDPVINQLRSSSINRDQFRLFAAQRAYIATNFVRLVRKGMELAREAGDEELAAALQSNLNDELGLDPSGNEVSELNHRVWKSNYLRAMQIEPDVQGFPLLDSTQDNVQAFLELEANGSMLEIAGAVLSLENIIPLEYRAAVTARDTLFPEIFCVADDDSPDTIAKKREARLYMDDHIIHDSQSHFPELLEALEKYERDSDSLQEIKQGIDRVNIYRKRFYVGLRHAMEFGPRLMDFYTLGC